MLQSEQFVPLNELERHLFARLVPEDHYLRQLLRVIDFERFRPLLTPHYAAREGGLPWIRCSCSSSICWASTTAGPIANCCARPRSTWPIGCFWTWAATPCCRITRR